jgi:CheY-like chemotaxis protein
VRRTYPDLPVVVLQADRDAEARREAEALAPSALVTKPFSPIELIELVRELLAGREARRA